MSSRRRTGLALALLLATAGLVWRAAHGRASESNRAVDQALVALAREMPAPLALLTENDEVDRAVGDAIRDGNLQPIAIVRRVPDLIDAAAQRGTLVAGRRGREYLEALGYELTAIEPDSTASIFRWARVERRRLRCASVTADAWSPLPGLEYTGRLGLALPAAAGGAMLLIVGDDLPLDVDISGADGASVRIGREVFHSVAATPPDYWIEGGSPREAPPHVQQLTMHASSDGDRVISARLGRRAPRVLARLRTYPGNARATVCAAPIGAEAAFRDGATAFVMAPTVDAYFGTGWSDALLLPGAGHVRWMKRDAALLVPFANRGDVQITLRAHRPSDTGDGQVSLLINDLFDAPALTLATGTRDYHWSVPAAGWVTGTNEVLLRVSGAGAERLLALERLELTLLHRE